MKCLNRVENLEEKIRTIKSSTELKEIVNEVKLFINDTHAENQVAFMKELYEICSKAYIKPSERYSRCLKNNVSIYTYPESLAQLFIASFLQLDKEKTTIDQFEQYLDRIWDCVTLMKKRETRTLLTEELEDVFSDYIVHKYIKRINSINPLSIFLINEERGDKLGLCFSDNGTKLALFAQNKNTGFTNEEALLYILGDIVFRHVYEINGNAFRDEVIKLGIKVFGKDSEEVIRKNTRYIFSHALLFKRKYQKDGVVGKNFLKNIGLRLPETLSNEVIQDANNIVEKFISI